MTAHQLPNVIQVKNSESPLAGPSPLLLGQPRLPKSVGQSQMSYNNNKTYVEQLRGYVEFIPLSACEYRPFSEPLRNRHRHAASAGTRVLIISSTQVLKTLLDYKANNVHKMLFSFTSRIVR